MPQFDFFSFSSQVFWVFLSFIFFYFLSLKLPFVNTNEVFKMRKKLVFFTNNLTKNFNKNTIYKKLFLNTFYK
jgi:hypothetical protein